VSECPTRHIIGHSDDEEGLRGVSDYALFQIGHILQKYIQKNQNLVTLKT